MINVNKLKYVRVKDGKIENQRPFLILEAFGVDGEVMELPPSAMTDYNRAIYNLWKSSGDPTYFKNYVLDPGALQSGEVQVSLAMPDDLYFWFDFTNIDVGTNVNASSLASKAGFGNIVIPPVSHRTQDVLVAQDGNGMRFANGQDAVNYNGWFGNLTNPMRADCSRNTMFTICKTQQGSTSHTCLSLYETGGQTFRYRTYDPNHRVDYANNSTNVPDPQAQTVFKRATIIKNLNNLETRVQGLAPIGRTDLPSAWNTSALGVIARNTASASSGAVAHWCCFNRVLNEDEITLIESYQDRILAGEQLDISNLPVAVLIVEIAGYD